MKYSVAAAALFAAQVFAQVATVTDALSAISAATSALDTGINGYNGGATEELQALADAVLSAINDGNDAVSGIDELSTTDAVGLVQPSNDLASVVTTTIDDTIAAKPTFDDAGRSGTILQNLQDIAAATDTFSTTVVGKVPTALQSTAQGLIDPINADLQRGIDAYAGSVDSEDGGDGEEDGNNTTTAAPSMSTATPAMSTAAPTTTDGMSAAPTSTGPSTVDPTATAAPTMTTAVIPPPINGTTPTMVPFTGAASKKGAALGAAVLAVVGAVAAF